MKKRLCTISLLVVFAGLLVASGWAAPRPIYQVAHRALACRDCHGTDQPTKPASSQSCKACHDSGNGTYLGKKVEYVESGRKRLANMHDSHVGPVRCTVCHVVHQTAPRSGDNAPTEASEKITRPLYCNHCHQFAVNPK